MRIDVMLQVASWVAASQWPAEVSPCSSQIWPTTIAVPTWRGVTLSPLYLERFERVNSEDTDQTFSNNILMKLHEGRPNSLLPTAGYMMDLSAAADAEFAVKEDHST